MVERERCRRLNDQPARRQGRYVLYWAQANRRVENNEALQFAIELANRWQRPVLFLETLSRAEQLRGHRFVRFLLEGIAATAQQCRERAIGYRFLVEPEENPLGEVARLVKRAVAVVTDDYPVPVVEARNSGFLAQAAVASYAVDASCIVPMRILPRREYGAYTIRPKIHRLLPRYLVPVPQEVPTVAFQEDQNEEPGGINGLLQPASGAPASLMFRGGRPAGLRWLERFLSERLSRYAAERHQPVAHAASELSPYLHYGYLGAKEVALAVRSWAEEYDLDASAFLEQLIIRRELAFNFACWTPEPASLAVLPGWARQTLHKHAGDRRHQVYSREELEAAATSDELWNAAQKELLLRGKIHNYPRMYWGKKIIEWSASYDEALATLLYLHERYALDAMDPNTYANVLWCFGLHDRPFQERPVLGTLRYFSLQGARRKLDVPGYIEEIRALERTGRDPWAVE